MNGALVGLLVMIGVFAGFAVLGFRWTRRPAWKPEPEPRADEAHRDSAAPVELQSELTRIIFGPPDGA